MSAPLLALLLAAAAASPLDDPGPDASPGTDVAEAATPPPDQPAAAPPRTWFFFPAPYYLPEAGVGLGIAGGRDFRVAPGARTSTALLIGAYSVEGLGSVDGSVDAWLGDGSLIAVRARGVNYPDRFYGIGPRASSRFEEFTRRFAEASASVELATLGGHLRAGPRVAARAEEILDTPAGGLLATSGLERLGGWSGVAVGGSVTWDTRDHPLWPLHGAFAQAYYLRYLAGVGRNDGFGKGAVDLRAFRSVGGGRVVAVNAVLETTDGATPFSLLSKLGNARFLRGYREGRYRDAMVWATQLELRTPVAGPVSGTLFGGAGDVFPDPAALTLQHPKLAAGIGARWRLTPGGANLRVDAAIGSTGPQFYVVLLEAF